MIWYKDRIFWSLWTVHAAVAIVLGWYFLLPVIQITLRNGGQSYTDSTGWYLLLAFLLPIWLTQFLAIALYPMGKLAARVLILIGAYIQISLPVVVALVITERFKMQKKWLRYLVLLIGTVILWKIMNEILALITILSSGFWLSMAGISTTL